jgi:putative oxidoreductase
MTDFFSNKYLLFALRIILGSLFIYSAVTKITDVDYFVKSLYNYKLLPEESLNYVALLIPWLELIIGLFILLGIFVKESALLGGILMVLFIAAIGIAVGRGLDIECGCFGTKDGSRVGLLKIIENLFILLGFIWLTFYGSDFLAILRSKKINAGSTGFPF